TCLLLYCPLAPQPLPSFPTRRSSDLKSQKTSAQTPAPPLTTGLPARQSRTLFPYPDPTTPEPALAPPRLYWSTSSAETFDETKRSEEHTSELQSRFDLVCRLLLEKKN